MAICQKPIEGFGIGLRSEHFSQILDLRPNVPWFEVLIDNYIDHPKACSVLEKIRADYPVVFHGIGLSIGSLDELDVQYLKKIKELINRFEPVWYSDHLSFSTHAGNYYPDLYPIIRNKNSFELILKKLNQVMKEIKIPIALENITAYFHFAKNEYSEVEFFKMIQSNIDIDLLLDINNVYVNSINFGKDPISSLKDYLGLRIRQLHIAGFESSKWGLIDTHGARVSSSVIDLLSFCSNDFKKIPICIERDKNIGAFTDLLAEREELIVYVQ